MASRTRALLGAVVLVWLLPATAKAEPTAADRDSARRLMSEAREKRDAKDLKGALQLFAAADGIMHVPTTGLELARTQAALGQLVVARDTALRVAHIAPEPHEPAQFAPARDAARVLSEELVRRIPVLKVVLHGAPSTPEAQVTVDGVTVPPLAIVVPRQVDPGHHHVSATAGTFGGSAEVDLAEGESKEATVEMVAAAPPPSIEAPRTPPAPMPSPEPSPQTAGGVGKPLMFAGFGVAGVGVVVGSIAGIVSATKTSTLKSTCNGGRCPLASASDIDSARSAATVSNVGFIVGGLGAAAGVVGLVLWRREAREPGSANAGQLRMTPWFGVASAGVRGSF